MAENKQLTAMILAAGKGERMRPLTLTSPKPLLHAGGKALIEHHLERLHRSGYHNVVINHAWLGPQLEAALGDGTRYGLAIAYSREAEALETAGGIRQALPLLTTAGQDWFLVINGDIWCDADLSRLTPPTGDCQALLVLADNPSHHPRGDFHLDDQGRVQRDGDPKLTFTGISLLHRSLFDPLTPGYHKLAPLLTSAMARGRVQGRYHAGAWFDIGTPERLGQLDEFLGGTGEP